MRRPRRDSLDDALLRSQLRAADVVALSKPDLADAAGRSRSAMPSSRVRPAATVGRCRRTARSPLALLFPADPDRAAGPRDPGRRRPVADRFETLTWTSDRPVSLPRLQAAIARLAPKLARAKGFFETVEQPGRQVLFQLAGGRATLAPAGPAAPGHPAPASSSSPKSAPSRAPKSPASWTAAPTPRRAELAEIGPKPE